MSRGFRTTLKGIVPEEVWPLLRWFDKQWIYCVYVWLWIKRKLVYPIVPIRTDCFASQSIGSFSLSAKYQHTQLEEILLRLKAQGKNILEGRHSVYIHDVNDIEQFCPGLLGKYPVGFGLKIVKSQIIYADSNPNYT
jgi:hypothetical protein